MASDYGQILDGSVRDAAMVVIAEEDVSDALLGEELTLQPAIHKFRPSRWQVAGISFSALVVGAIVLFIADPCQAPLRSLFNATPLQLSEETKMEFASRKLRNVKSKAEADELVAKAMAAAKTERALHYKSRKHAVLPPSRDLQNNPFFHFHNKALWADAQALKVQAKGRDALLAIRDPDIKQQENFRQAFCVFNSVETIDSIGGTALDVEAMVHTCPEPRNDVGDFSCAVNSETLAEMVGSAATWLSNAVSTCDVLPSANAECGAAVSGIVSALGEVAASASLAMTACKEYPLAGFRQAEQYCVGGDCRRSGGIMMSQAGRQDAGRRLFIGSGIGGMGVQCAVDIGFVVDNIYDSIFFIQQAARLDFCSKNVRYGPYNYITGVPEAACAFDVAGAIAWITQIATFIEQLISHCPDLLDLPTLCGSSATGMLSAANQIASWGSGVAISCARGESLTMVPLTMILAEYSFVAGREVEFVKLCSKTLDSFGVKCQWVASTQEQPTPNVRLDLAGTRDGLLLAEAQIRMSGLQVPGFQTLTFVRIEASPFLNRRLEDRRLEEDKQIDDMAKDMNKKWDPMNHPKMKALREAMRELREKRNELTRMDTEPAQNLTFANLKEKLHLIEPALEQSDKKGYLFDTCA
mmetsp:Transcript_13331/g.25091  ORF Transcript_13331/g.25091 Transcript_13331/m.25091 type:complete len:640 (+) Transcript_13331:80-1999(+)